MSSSKDFEAQFDAVYERIKNACLKSGRGQGDVSLVAVSKTQPLQSIQAYIDYCEHRSLNAIIGENYVQEWQQKKADLKGSFSSHLIGHLQSNKSKLAVQCFDAIQTIDSAKTLQHLEKEASLSKKKIGGWIQVNISDDQAKYGIPVGEALPLAKMLINSSLEFLGLMTITKEYENPEEALPDYKALSTLGYQLRQEFGLAKVGLSMGMSQDFEVAIAAGATHVRVGSALFGKRK